MFVSIAVQDLCKDIIENKSEWSFNRYTYDKKSKGISIWVSDGVFFIDFYPKQYDFNIFEKIKIKSAIKKSMIRNITSKIESIKD